MFILLQKPFLVPPLPLSNLISSDSFPCYFGPKLAFLLILGQGNLEPCLGICLE